MGAVICPGCEFILDTSFLGDDITDDDRAIRRLPKPGKKNVDFGEDAMILGDAADQEWSDFRSRDAGVSQREVTQARFYIGGSTAQLLHPDAVPEVVPTAIGGAARLTPFEKHVLDFINGKRSVGRIQKKSGMEDSEFKTSLAMLSDKGVIRLRTMKKRKKGAPSSMQASLSEQRAEIPDLDASDRTIVAPPPAERAPPARSRASGRPAVAPNDDDGATELAMPRPARASREGRPESRGDAPSVGGGAFRSLKAESEAEQEAARDAAPGSASDSGKSMRDAWGSGASPANSSSIFARAKAKKKKEPSLVERDADAAEEQQSALSESVRARLQPITGEDVAMPEQPSLLPGVPPDDDDDLLFTPGSAEDAPARDDAVGDAERPRAARGEDDDASKSAEGDFDVPTGPRRPLATSNTMTREYERADAKVHDSAEARALAALPSRLGSRVENTEARDLSNVETGPLPESDEKPSVRPPPVPDDADDAEAADDEGGDDDDDVGFDVDLHTATADRLSNQHTASLPGSIPELPSDALMAIPSEEARPAPVRPPVAPAPQYMTAPPLVQAPPSLPGQALVRPGTPASGPGARPSAPTANATGGRPATLRPGIPGGARPSAGSSVPFEQARKAEKIFEQAQKDHAEGRQSSARMNAKLAVQFDPSVPAYKEFLAVLDEAAVGMKPVAVKPREVLLFEQASEAEGRGDYEKAAKFLKDALEINSKAAQLHNRLGVVLSIRLKRHDEALRYLKNAIELEPGSLVYMNNYSKVTAALESQRDKDPEEKRGRMDKDAKVDIKKMRPKMF